MRPGNGKNLRTLISIPIRIALTLTVSIAATFVVGIEIGKHEIRNEYAAADSVIFAYGPVPPPDTILVVTPAAIIALQENRDRIAFLQDMLLEKPDTIRINVPAPFAVASAPETLIVNHWFPVPPDTVYLDSEIDDPWDDPWDWGNDPRRPSHW